VQPEQQLSRVRVLSSRHKNLTPTAMFCGGASSPHLSTALLFTPLCVLLFPALQYAAQRLILFPTLHCIYLAFRLLPSDETGALVVDVGACSARFGWAGEDAPKSVFSSVSYLSAHPRVSCAKTQLALFSLPFLLFLYLPSPIPNTVPVNAVRRCLPHRGIHHGGFCW